MQPNFPPPLLLSIVTENPNPNSENNPMQAVHFLRFLSCLNSRPLSSTTTAHRARFVRRASYASMAYVARPRRVWGQILLQRLRRQTIRRSIRSSYGSRGRSRLPRRTGNTSRADELRRLVPGGESLDLCSLLEEAGDYVQCLKAQVKLMQTLADSLSAKEA